MGSMSIIIMFVNYLFWVWSLPSIGKFNTSKPMRQEQVLNYIFVWNLESMCSKMCSRPPVFEIIRGL